MSQDPATARALLPAAGAISATSIEVDTSASAPPRASFGTIPNVRLGPRESDWARRHLHTLLDSEDSTALQPFERELLHELADALEATGSDDHGETERTAAAASALIVGLILAGRLRRPHARAIWDALCERGQLPPAARRFPMRLLPRDRAELH